MKKYFDFSLIFRSFVLGTDISMQKNTAQLTFTCSESTIETLEKSVKYVQS